MAQVDWNVTVLILDTLSVGAHSFTELDDYISHQHSQSVVRESLAVLAKQNLICVLEGAGHQEADEQVSAEERFKRIERFFEIANEDRQSSVANWIDLTDGGKTLLRLIGIGHPPL